MNKEEPNYIYRGAKLYFATLKPDNVDLFFDAKYNQWLYFNSSKVSINGSSIKAGWERFVNMIPDKKEREILTRKAEVSCSTRDGFELTIACFVDEELKKYNSLYIELEGNSKYRELRLKIKKYIDYLAKIKGNGYDSDTICINKNLVAEQIKLLFENLIDSRFIDAKTDRDCFSFVLNGTPLPIGKVFKPIIWLKNKQLLRELLFGHEVNSIIGIAGKVEIKIEIEKRISTLFCDSKNKPFKLASNKHVESTDSDKIKDILATL